MIKLIGKLTLVITLTAALVACSDSRTTDNQSDLSTGSDEDSNAITGISTGTESDTSNSIISFYGPDSLVRLASGEGGFDRILDRGDRFGRDHDRAGDINGRYN